MTAGGVVMPKTATLVCARCGQTFETLAKELKRGRKFCSVKCRQAGQAGAGNFNYRGGTSARPRVYVDRFRARHPEKARAHDLVKRALVSGRLVRMNCEACGSMKSEAHHDDYSQPFAVRWLCRPHHRAAHRGAA